MLIVIKFLDGLQNGTFLSHSEHPHLSVKVYSAVFPLRKPATNNFGHDYFMCLSVNDILYLLYRTLYQHSDNPHSEICLIPFPQNQILI